ncbi:MAG: BBP7 family outer membrane beta-barrel protein [Thermoguttaceae bacterium]
MESVFRRLGLWTAAMILLMGAGEPFSALGQTPPTLFAPGQVLPPTSTPGTYPTAPAEPGLLSTYPAGTNQMPAPANGQVMPGGAAAYIPPSPPNPMPAPPPMQAPGQTPPYTAAQTPSPAVRDPVKSLCPDAADFFLLPPRTPWYGYIDALALRRDATHNQDFQELGPGGPVVLSTEQMDFDFRAGVKAMIGHTLNDCVSVEALYFAVDSWSVGESVSNGAGNLFSPFSNFGLNPIPGATVDNNTFASIHSFSQLQNFELNLRRQLPMPAERLTASILFGLRYIDLPEHFEYFTSNTTAGSITNLVDVQTGNQMVGAQVGAMFEFYLENRWWANFEIKGAFFDDMAQQATTYTQSGSAPVPFATRQDGTSYLVDIDLTFLYRWTPHLATRIGYQAMWLEQVATASANFNSDLYALQNGHGELNQSSNIIYHGPHAGIMFTW